MSNFKVMERLNLEQQNFESRENHLLENRNLAQLMLAEMMGIDILIFIKDGYAKKVSDYIDEHSDILDRFDNDKDGVVKELHSIVCSPTYH